MSLALIDVLVVTAYQYRVVVVAVRPRARQGQPLGGEAVRGMLGGAGGCVAVLIFTLTYHLGHDGVEWDLLSCCRCTPVSYTHLRAHET